jgi:hypothetical protein
MTLKDVILEGIRKRGQRGKDYTALDFKSFQNDTYDLRQSQRNSSKSSKILLEK